LADRSDDIPVLLDYFLEQLRKKYRKGFDVIPEDTRSLLLGYSWPGNIREFKNTIERAVILSTDATFHPHLLTAEILDASNSGEERQYTEVNAPGDYWGKEAEKLQHLLDVNYWNITKVANELGVARSTIYRKIGYYHLTR
jgi:transcriptional regulator with PAS, ATPase and Fis domain